MLARNTVAIKEYAYQNCGGHFHWYISIIPRVSKMAGFELGSGIFINVAIPEESAEFLRGVKQAQKI